MDKFYLDLERAKRFADKHEGLSSKILWNKLHITSKTGEWYIEQRGGSLVLFHRNHKGYKKDGFHEQRRTKASPTGLLFCVQHITAHDKYTMNGRKMGKSRMERLFEQVARGTAVKVPSVY